ncbi:hypothetical protein Dimus_022886 [Dionaea muscipula]
MTAFVGAQEAYKEETEFDEVIGKGERLKRRRQKQEARIGPRIRARKAKYSVQEDEDKEEVKKEENPSDRETESDVATDTGDEEKKDGLEKEDGEDEDVGQRDGKGVVAEEVEVEEEGEDESDESEQPLTKKHHLGVLTRRRLTIPHSKMVTTYANVLMGSSSRGARRYLSSLPPSHEIALVMRNVAELAALSGHSLSHSLRHDAIRQRNRRTIRGVQAEERLNNELTFEKKRLTELATAALQLKSDMVKVTKEKQSVEEENERLKAELEKEKSKGKRSSERLMLLHNGLGDLSLKNVRLHNTLNEMSGKVIKIAEKRNLVEDCLPKQLNFMTKEAQCVYLESEEFIGVFNRASAPVFENG